MHSKGAYLVLVALSLYGFAVEARLLRLDLPAQSLRSALVALADAADIQLLFPEEEVHDRQAPALRGEFAVDEALDTVLRDSGLSWRYVAPDTVVVGPATDEARTIGAVQVAGTQMIPGRGASGSSDRFATEGSTSYAAPGTSVGGFPGQALVDTPRAVSVLGLPQMQDQGIVELSDALRQFPSVAAEGMPGDSLVVSVRGRTLEEYQFDGGATLPLLNDRIAGDLSAYDRVELLGGADGLGNGFALPSGVLNLVRKRPLDRAQVITEAMGGAWDHQRGMLDVNAPPVWGGRLRGRAVASAVDRDLFYDRGWLRRQSWYGVAEADLTPHSLVGGGVHIVDQSGSPWELGGLPRLESGELLPVDRGTSFLLPWNREESRSRHAFLRFEQAIGPRWSAWFSVDHLREDREALTSELFGDVDPESGFGPLLFHFFRDQDNTHSLAAANVRGRFQLLGRQHFVLFNVNHADHDIRDRVIFPIDVDFPNVFAFETDDFPPPEFSRLDLTEVQDERRRRYGGSVALTLNPLTPLEVTAAWRWSAWSSRLRMEPDWPGLPERPRIRKHGVSYVALSWALMRDVNLYASWADAFIVSSGIMTRDGAMPPPTVGDNYEAGVKVALMGDRLQARLTFYRSDRRNFPRQTEESPESVFCCYDSSGDDRDRIQGVESEIVGTLLRGWNIAAGYTYATLDYRYQESPAGLEDGVARGATLDPRTPRHALRLWTVWEPRPGGSSGLQLGTGLRAQSRSLIALTEHAHGPTRLDSYTVVDALLAWRIHPGWRAALHARNVLDREYLQFVPSGNGAFHGEPRSFVLGLRGEF